MEVISVRFFCYFCLKFFVMEKKSFVFHKPLNDKLLPFVESFFYAECSAQEFTENQFITPYPRITLGYFFDFPFVATNHTRKQTEKAHFSLSRITTDKVSVTPLYEQIKVVGVHLKPFALAFFYEKNPDELPWLTNIDEFLPEKAKKFREKAQNFQKVEELFFALEEIFFSEIPKNDFSMIEKAISVIENNYNPLNIKELSEKIATTERTLRNHFYKYIGCSPKEYFRIVKIQEMAMQILENQLKISDLAYDNSFFDSAHLHREIKNITGFSPKKFKKNIQENKNFF